MLVSKTNALSKYVPTGDQVGREEGWGLMPNAMTMINTPKILRSWT